MNKHGKTHSLPDTAFVLASRLIDERLDQQLLRDAQMPHTYYGILVMLSHSDGGSLRMSRLANVLRLSPSRLTHAVAKMEQRGWIQREASTEDGRGQVAKLTEAGSVAIDAAAPGHVSEVRSVLFDALTAEQVSQLWAIFDTVLDNLEVVRVGANPPIVPRQHLSPPRSIGRRT
jgi:DNA-binding MarR family transcriptional regulator